MNKRISRNGINRIAKEYKSLLHSARFRDWDTKYLFDVMVSKLADMLADDNENFERYRFIDAIYKK